MIKNLFNKYFDIPKNLYSKENKYLLLATFFGCGYLKKAPGTFASFIALLIGLLIGSFSSSLLVIITIFLILVGFFVSERIVNFTHETDPQYIVIDEVVGMLLAMLLVNSNIILSIIAFVIFRILDIKKPWLIGIAETQFKGGAAVMMDDIIAGFVTLLIITGISVLY